MAEYGIKTSNFNLFKGTRAEDILNSLGEKKTVVTGELEFVLPALATLNDLKKMDIRNNIKTELVTNTLEHKGFLDNTYDMAEFYFDLMHDKYGINIRNEPVTKDPTFVLINVGREYLQELNDYEYRSFVNYASDLIGSYRNPKTVLVYDGLKVSNPGSKIPVKLRDKVDNAVNSKSHNVFFNTYLEEMLDIETEGEEIVIIGSKLEDQVLYSAIGAVDLEFNPKVTVLPGYTITELADIRRNGKYILERNLNNILDVNLVEKKQKKYKANGGINIFME
ncbi:hypothetical protein ACFL1H_02960 [Nanoarchaeota archaeon]